MINIPLQAVPNQSLSIQLDQINFDIRIHSCGQSLIPEANTMVFTIFINGVRTISSFRATPGSAIIPYLYLEDGNFVMITQNDAYPSYDQFGITQYLIYASAAEIEALYATNT